MGRPFFMALTGRLPKSTLSHRLFNNAWMQGAF